MFIKYNNAMTIEAKLCFCIIIMSILNAPICLYNIIIVMCLLTAKLCFHVTILIESNFISVCYYKFINCKIIFAS